MQTRRRPRWEAPDLPAFLSLALRVVEFGSMKGWWAVVGPTTFAETIP